MSETAHRMSCGEWVIEGIVLDKTPQLRVKDGPYVRGYAKSVLEVEAILRSWYGPALSEFGEDAGP